MTNQANPVVYIAIDQKIVDSIQATLEACQLELERIRKMGRDDEPLTQKQAAEYLKISRQTLASYASIMAIAVSEYGGKVWYMRSELDAFLARHRRKS